MATSSTEGQAPKEILSGWRGRLFIIALCTFAAVGFWGRITHNGALQAIGFWPILALTGLVVVWSKYKATRDPEFAARLAKEQEKAKRRSEAKQRALLREIPWLIAPLGVLFALGYVLNPLLAREPVLADAIASMSPPHQRILSIGLAIGLVCAARLCWWFVQRQNKTS